MTKQKDYRIQVSKQMIKEGFIELLQKKSIREITVKELCLHVHINRSTFYSYFFDLYDLLSHIEQEMYDDLKYTLDHCSYEMADIDNSIYNSIFSFFIRHQKMGYVLLCKDADAKFVHKVIEMGKQKFFEVYQTFKVKYDQTKLEYFYIGVSNMYIGIISHWLNSGMVESPKDIATITKNIVSSSLSFFMR